MTDTDLSLLKYSLHHQHWNVDRFIARNMFSAEDHNCIIQFKERGNAQTYVRLCSDKKTRDSQSCVIHCVRNNQPT